MNNSDISKILYLTSKYGKSNILNELKDETYINAAKKRLSQKNFQSAQSFLSHSKSVLLTKFQKTLQHFDWFHDLDCNFTYTEPGGVQRVNLHLTKLPVELHKNKTFGYNEPKLPDNILNDIINTCIQFNNIIHGMDFYGYYCYKHTMVSFIILSREVIQKVSKTLFHVTNSKYLNKIKHDGLVPQQASKFWETYYYNALFALQKINDAKKFIKHAEKNQEYFIIEFKPTPQSIFFKDLIEINDGLKSSVYTHDSIPAENIIRIYNQKLEIIYENI